ncbi:hypothetical protein CCR97_28675 [Rhodoplanes elegans]|uniref:Uncharacterized protein n=1 Tax=Rhodoplanes elegans TaxID=29408 RepID=A0A327KR53_9BRAD|nr:hypothetical protein [Rhodoplanes elegans]MBK5962136.1 hypothetical protein [Rhodoplanes elegans]RAI40113.1 hypothetical protein CH338_07235 [Rhodoplanes elegans]
MTKLFDQAVEAARALPPDAQDELARVMLDILADDRPPEPIDPADAPAVREGLAQADRGEFATDAEVDAALHRFEA